MRSLRVVYLTNSKPRNWTISGSDVWIEYDPNRYLDELKAAIRMRPDVVATDRHNEEAEEFMKQVHLPYVVLE